MQEYYYYIEEKMGNETERNNLFQGYGICGKLAFKDEASTLGEQLDCFYSRTMFVCLTLARLHQILHRESQER